MSEKFVVTFNSGEAGSRWFSAINRDDQQIMDERMAIALARELNGVGGKGNVVEQRPAITATVIPSTHPSLAVTRYGYVRVKQEVFKSCRDRNNQTQMKGGAP